jgi:hypothetical protein
MSSRIERAKPRYSYQLPVVVSAMSKDGASRGLTRDISASGVYFYTDDWSGQTSQFDFKIIMPAEITGAERRRALCRAHVVRVEEGAGSKVGVAAKIDEIVWM